MRLSLCMVVRNEEAFIGRCLDHVRGLVDEMVVLDTGSTDRTVAIAAAAGARVYPFAWGDDFAAARNEALRYVRGDWVLVLDADEIVDRTSHGAIRRLLEAPTPTVYGFPRPHYRDPEGTRWYEDPSYVWRLYPNLPGLHYQGCIHESLHLPPLAIALQPVDEGVRIFHYGYLPQIVASQGKLERDYRLLQRRVGDEPPDPYMFRLLGRCGYRLGRFDAAVQALRRALELWAAGAEPSAPARDWADTHVDLARALLGQGRSAEAAQHCAIAVEMAPELAGAHFVQGRTRLHQGDWAAALGAYERALACFDGTARYDGVEQWEVLQAIGQVHGTQQRWAAARTWLERAHALCPDDPSLLLDLADAEQALARPAEAERYIHAVLGAAEASVDAWQRLANLYVMRGAVRDAEAALRAGLEQHVASPELHAALARLLARQGRTVEAIPHWTRSLQGRPAAATITAGRAGGAASGTAR
jgi:tetratricopeptide (TPR) repeat protein